MREGGTLIERRHEDLNCRKFYRPVGKRGYRPSTTNELQLQPNIQSRVLIMPVFLNESNAKVIARLSLQLI